MLMVSEKFNSQHCLFMCVVVTFTSIFSLIIGVQTLVDMLKCSVEDCIS